MAMLVYRSVSLRENRGFLQLRNSRRFKCHEKHRTAQSQGASPRLFWEQILSEITIHFSIKFELLKWRMFIIPHWKRLFLQPIVSAQRGRFCCKKCQKRTVCITLERLRHETSWNHENDGVQVRHPLSGDDVGCTPIPTYRTPTGKSLYKPYIT